METPVYDIRDQKILFCVLNWGLGHASRSTSIIKILQHHNEVHLAADGAALTLLRQEFPDVPMHTLPGYNVTYGRDSLVADMALQFPKIMRAYIQEKAMVHKLQEDEKYDIVISDHRYGCRTRTTHNIFVAHQINIMADNAYLSKAATRVNAHFINKFDACWVPDEKGSLLSGLLSTPDRLKRHPQYIGVQSRFVLEDQEQKYDYAIVLSGPEPARTKLERKLWNLFEHRTDIKIIMVRGTDEPHTYNTRDHFTIQNLLMGKDLNLILNQSQTVICRSGYSSIMDLYTLQKNAILIPTPGQTEQEYLAKHLEDNLLFRYVKEEDLDRYGF